ncbi:MAG: hypothetical protein OXC91_00570 [Rhodobacteraceae bacterium]|nr:hypothetical protein [Paracoccaceae bacterium]
MRHPDRKAAKDGWNGLKPAAIASALTKIGQLASLGQIFYSMAKVVFRSVWSGGHQDLLLCGHVSILAESNALSRRSRHAESH